METRVFRLTVRFLLSTVLAPRGVQKPTRSLRSKTLPPLSPFHSPCVMCNGVGCGCLSVQHPPCPGGRPRRPCRPGEDARRMYGAMSVCRLHPDIYSQSSGHLTGRNQSPDLPTPSVSHRAVSLRVLSGIRGNPVWWEKSISSQRLIVLHNDNLLCCRELPSS